MLNQDFLAAPCSRGTSHWTTTEKDRSQPLNQEFGSTTGGVAPSFTPALACSPPEKWHTTSKEPVVMAHQGPQCLLPDLQPIWHPHLNLWLVSLQSSSRLSFLWAPLQSLAPGFTTLIEFALSFRHWSIEIFKSPLDCLITRDQFAPETVPSAVTPTAPKFAGQHTVYEQWDHGSFKRGLIMAFLRKVGT